MFLLEQILPAALRAMLAATAVCGLAHVAGWERFGATAIPLALGIGYAAGHFFVTGWGSFPPNDTTNWLPYFALAAGLMTALGSMLGLRTRWRHAIFTLLAIGAMRLLLRPKFQYEWSPIQGWLSVAGLAIALLLIAVVLDKVARKSTSGFDLPGFLLIICSGTFLALLLSGSVLLGQFAAILGWAVIGTMIWCVRNPATNRGVVPLFSLLQGALIVSGCLFASLPVSSAILLALAPLVVLLPIKMGSPLLNLGIRGGLILLPVAAALVVAYFSSPPLDY